MNVGERQAAADTQTKPIYLDGAACRLLSSTDHCLIDPEADPHFTVPSHERQIVGMSTALCVQPRLAVVKV